MAYLGSRKEGHGVPGGGGRGQRKANFVNH